jgi:hypothetical protein
VFASELAKQYGSPEEYIDRIDRMLTYLARYGHQSMVELQTTVATVDLMAWVRHMGIILDEEAENAKKKG